MTKIGAHVLVVEDDPDIRDGIVELLTRYGHPSVGAQHGRDALDLLERDEELPCVILLDLMMPVMDGRAFREEQLRNPRLATIPVIVVSAYAQYIQGAADLGVAAQIKKPIKMPELLRLVRDHCAPATS